MPRSSVPAPVSSNSASPTRDCLAHRFGNANDRPYRRPRHPSGMSDAGWAVPADFPAWDRVHTSFRRRRDKRLAGEFHDRLRDRPAKLRAGIRSRLRASSPRSR